jgi:hemerythrin superfamily protein
MAAQRETISDRIRADHRDVMERIAELERRGAGPGDEPLEPALVPIRTDLLAHMAAEEEFVYDLLETEMRSWIENSRREHEAARDHLAALAAGGTRSAAWWDRLREMKRVLEQHIAEEERAVLPQVEMNHDLERLCDLGDEFARRKGEAGTVHGPAGAGT